MFTIYVSDNLASLAQSQRISKETPCSLTIIYSEKYASVSNKVTLSNGITSGTYDVP